MRYLALFRPGSLIRLTSGQIWDFWGTSVGRNVGGLGPVAQAAFGVDAFGCWEGKCRQKSGVHRSEPVA